MTDIFREVDEDLRRDQLKKLWQRFGRWIIVGAVLIVVAVAVWAFMQQQAEQRAGDSGDRYNAALALAADGSLDEARAELAALEADGANAYPTFAAMQAAALQAEGGDVEGAVATYDGIVADTTIDKPLRDVASLRAALLLIDSAPYSEILARMTPLTADENQFRHLARELIAVSALANDDLENGRDWVITLLSGDPPQGTAIRGQALLALISSRGGFAQSPALVDSPAADFGEPEAFDPLDPGALLRAPDAGAGFDPLAPAEGVIPIPQPGFDSDVPADEAAPAEETPVEEAPAEPAVDQAPAEETPAEPGLDEPAAE